MPNTHSNSLTGTLDMYKACLVAKIFTLEYCLYRMMTFSVITFFFFRNIFCYYLTYLNLVPIDGPQKMTSLMATLLKKSTCKFLLPISVHHISLVYFCKTFYSLKHTLWAWFAKFSWIMLISAFRTICSKPY